MNLGKIEYYPHANSQMANKTNKNVQIKLKVVQLKSKGSKCIT